MRQLIILLSFFFQLPCFSQTDLSLGAQGRSFPFSAGELFAEAGHNFKFWEKESPQFKVNPFFGLIRPSVGVNSSVLVNAYKGEVEFFPISFIGFSTGYQKVESNFDFPFFDCEKIFCQLQVERRWIEGKVALKYKEALLLIFLKEDHLAPSRGGKNFGEFRRVITGQDGGDQLRELRIVLGRSFENKLIGVVHEWAMFNKSREDSRTTFGVYQVKKDKQTYMLGLGAFESDEVGRGPIAYLRWTYQFSAGLKLF
jgi:hypothetical protein